MIKEMIKKIKSKFSKKADIGLSFDSKVKLKEMPVIDLSKKSPFYSLNKDLGFFEVIRVSKNPDLICLIEVGTDNEFVVERKTFDFLFSNLEVPKEAIF